MTGLRRDQKRLVEYRAKIDGVIQRKLGELRRMVGNAEFNPNSPKQVVQLLKVLGIRDATSSGAIEINKAKFAHPLNAHILDYVSKKADDLENVDEFSIRGLRKLATTYLRTDDDAKKTGIHAGEGGAKEFYGRILYALNPHGTDTGRLASREHHFWCGIQIQNIPVGPTIKATVRAEDGFYIGECDLEQAESRDTAHISGDEKMIEAVTGPRDFHSVNASAFFGISYSDLFDDSAKKSLNKPIRNLSKRTNHGANYNMTAPVLVDTMGLKNTFEAGRLLKLPYRDPIKIGEYLLERFHETYSKLRGRKAPFEPGTYYSWVVEQVLTGKKLVSRAYHHTKFNLENYTSSEYISRGDWTRYCFGRPDKSKPDLNSYVAHPPQSLNARTLNEGYMRVFYEIALPNAEHFRLYAQIHDSILFGYKCDRADLAHKVKDCMEIPVTVRDISGNYRTFTVPAALKLGKPGANYWSECE